MKSIGLDAHSATFTMAVLTPHGKPGRCFSRPTSAANLIDAVQGISGAKQLVVEECHLAQWIKETLERYVDKLIVCDPQRNKWIAQDDFADDKSSAIKLAKLLQGGFIKEIRHPGESGAALRRLFLHYYDLNQQVVRFKNKLKALFRQIAIATPGGAVYDSRQAARWLAQLREPDRRHEAKHLFFLVHELEAMKQRTHEALVKRARKRSAHKLLKGIRGVGPVLACGYLALIDTPHRFSRKNKLWRYACLGNVYHESDARVYSNRPSSGGNRVLKWVVVEHFNAVVTRARKPNRFKRQQEALIRRGVPYKAARRMVCRALLSVVRAVWMKGEAYREAPLN